jgi:hypothetical protein
MGNIHKTSVLKLQVRRYLEDVDVRVIGKGVVL